MGRGEEEGKVSHRGYVVEGRPGIGRYPILFYTVLVCSLLLQSVLTFPQVVLNTIVFHW